MLVLGSHFWPFTGVLSENSREVTRKNAEIFSATDEHRLTHTPKAFASKTGGMTLTFPKNSELSLQGQISAISRAQTVEPAVSAAAFAKMQAARLPLQPLVQQN
jgi:hypothetical protein